MDHFLEMTSDGRLNTKIYDKRDDFNFHIVNFLFLCSNIPATPAYGVYVSQLIRYSRASSKYVDFVERGMLLSRKLLRQGYESIKVRSSLKKFYGRHHELMSHYDDVLSILSTSQYHFKVFIVSLLCLHCILSVCSIPFCLHRSHRIHRDVNNIVSTSCLYCICRVFTFLFTSFTSYTSRC